MIGLWLERLAAALIGLPDPPWMMPDADDWTCFKCGFRNKGHWLQCHNCGAHI